MRTVILCLFAIAFAAGCHAGPRPDSGMAALRVKVIAEPKAAVARIVGNVVGGDDG